MDNTSYLDDTKYQIIIIVVVIIICYYIFMPSTSFSTQSYNRPPFLQSDGRPPISNMSLRPGVSNFEGKLPKKSNFVKSNYANTAFMDNNARNAKHDNLALQTFEHMTKARTTQDTAEVDTSLFTTGMQNAHDNYISKNGVFRSGVSLTNTEDQPLGVQPWNQYAAMRQGILGSIPLAPGSLTTNSYDPIEKNITSPSLQILGIGGGYNQTNQPYSPQLY